MKKLILFCLLLLPVSAHADDSDILKAKMQAMMDAVAPGDKGPWEATLDPRYVSTDENGEVAHYDDTIAQIVPLPKGSSGTITVTDGVAGFSGGCLRRFATASAVSSTAREMPRAMATKNRKRIT